MQTPLKKAILFFSQHAWEPLLEQIKELGSVHIDSMHPTYQYRPLPERVLVEKVARSQSGAQKPSQNDPVHAARRINQLKEEIAQEEAQLKKYQKAYTYAANWGLFPTNMLQVIPALGRTPQWFTLRKECSTALGAEDFIIKRSDKLLYGLSLRTESLPEPFQQEIDFKTAVQIDSQIKHSEGIIFQKYTLLHSLERMWGDFQLSLPSLYEQEQDDNATAALANCLGCCHYTSIWVVAKDWSKMQAIAAKHRAVLLEQTFSVDDMPPVALENTGLSALGEDILLAYDPPQYGEGDPSLWVLLSFTFFFGVILSDAVYGGCVAFAGALLMRHCGSTFRPARLLTILGGWSCLWGIAMGAFAGFQIPLDSYWGGWTLPGFFALHKLAYLLQTEHSQLALLLQKYPTLSTLKTPIEWLQYYPPGKDISVVGQSMMDGILQEWALTIGLLHILSSMLRGITRQWARAGWFVATLGAYFFLADYLNAVTLFQYGFGLSSAALAQFGAWAIQGGIGAAVLLACYETGWTGLFEWTQAIQIFSDILSYLRLYALALAGGIMGGSFNAMALGLGPILGLPLWLIGHSINFTLGVMGGFIHGLRLNFLEWCRYSYEGGGRLFRPLRFWHRSDEEVI